MDKFIEAVAALVEHPRTTSIGKVRKITESSCEVEREGLPELLDVRLNAVIGDVPSFFTVFPKIGSEVLVVEVQNNKQETAIVKYTEIDKVAIKIDAFDFEVDKNGLSIKNEGENLKTIIGDLIDELNKILVIQGNTINIPAMNSIKERFNKVLK